MRSIERFGAGACDLSCRALHPDFQFIIYGAAKCWVGPWFAARGLVEITGRPSGSFFDTEAAFQGGRPNSVPLDVTGTGASGRRRVATQGKHSPEHTP